MKSEATVIDQLNGMVDVTRTSPLGKPEKLYLSASSLEERISNRIQKYWAERGYSINIAVRDIAHQRNGHQDITYRAARSNLMNGLPIGYNELALGTCMYVKPEKYRKGNK
jgi:hypothetical protein